MDTKNSRTVSGIAAVFASSCTPRTVSVYAWPVGSAAPNVTVAVRLSAARATDAIVPSVTDQFATSVAEAASSSVLKTSLHVLRVSASIVAERMPGVLSTSTSIGVGQISWIASNQPCAIFS